MRPLVSVVIPAFNQYEFTARAINSVCKQSHRPIEIVVSDDCSPSSLAGLAGLSCLLDSNISYKYFRQSNNQGYYFNLLFALKQSTGDFLVLLDHDDWLIDSFHLELAVDYMLINNKCNAVVKNTSQEISGDLFFDSNKVELSPVDGAYFISSHLFNDIHPSRSAVVINFGLIRSYVFNFFVSKSLCTELRLIPDESFVCICLAASLGSIAFSGSVVSVRGQHPSQLTKTNSWKQNSNSSMWFHLFKLFNYFWESKRYFAALALLKILILNFPIKPNLRFILNVQSSFFATIVICIGCFVYIVRKIFRHAH